MATTATGFNTKPTCSTCGKDIAISIGRGQCLECMAPKFLKKLVK